MDGLYFYLLLFTISFPLGASFDHRFSYAKKWAALFPAIGITATFFLIWDAIFTRQGVWGFNEDYTMDLYLLRMPLEEWLFFVIIPFACVFIYECVCYFFPKLRTNQKHVMGARILAAVLLISAALFCDRAYTFWNFLFGGLALLLVSLHRPKWLAYFIVAYLFHLIPFFLVNGILTGSFLPEPIVWYNNEENLGIRIGTIPLEDTMYSMLLLLMNVTGFEYFKSRIISKQKGTAVG